MDHRRSEVNESLKGLTRFTLLVAALALPADARAQTPLAEVIPRMLGPDMTIAPGPGGTHANDFARDLGTLPDQITFGNLPNGTESFAQVFNSTIAQQLLTIPTVSASGGFLYSFDKDLGTFARSTRSFGPSYAERPLTSGRRTFSAGFSVQSIEYDRFHGVPLNGNDVHFFIVHRDIANSCVTSGGGGISCSPAYTPERSDLMEVTLHLRIRNRTILSGVTYGVTDRLDVGLTIPIVSTTLEAGIDKRIVRLGTASTPTTHSFDGRGADTTAATGGGTASGLGDLQVHAKYNFVREALFKAAASADIRLPTGDSRNLLGRGAPSLRLLGIVATGSRTVSPHANVGVTFVGENTDTAAFIGSPFGEFNCTFGFDWSIVPRATVSADVLVRQQIDNQGASVSLEVGDARFPYATPGGSFGSFETRQFQVGSFSAPNVVQAAIGGKVGPWRTMLLFGNVLLPVSDAAGSLRNKPALNVGVEYTF